MKTILLVPVFLGLFTPPACFGIDGGRPDNLPKYKIELSILPDKHHLAVQGTISLPLVNAARERIVLALTEQATDLKMSLVEPVHSLLKLEKIERAGTPAGLRRWSVLLSANHNPQNSSVALEFSYTIKNGLDSIFYIGPEGSFASGLNTAWYPQLEDENQFRMRGTGSVRFNLPPAFSAYSSGVQRATVEENRKGTFQFHMTIPVFFSFGVAKYVIHKSDGGLPISVYLLRSRPPEKIRNLIEGSSRVINALSGEFGPYPYPEFAIVEMPAREAQKGGSDGACLEGFMMGISYYFDQEFNTAFFGHEIGHIWWGNMIQRKGLDGVYTIDEGLAQYGSLRAVEILEGSQAAEKYRRTGYPGYYSEYSGFTYLARATAGLDHKLSQLPLSNGFLSRRVTNSKGMIVWDMLSRTVGRKRFAEILGDFTRKNAFQRVTWQELLQAIQNGAGTDLKWFFDQWFERTGAPDLKLTWKQDGKHVRGAISQSAPYYKASIEVEASAGNSSRVVRTIQVAGPKTEFTWPLGFRVKTLTLDPHFLLLRWTPEYRQEANALLRYTLGDLKLSQGQIAEARAEFESALTAVPNHDQYGFEFLLEYGLAQALTEQGELTEAKKHILAALTTPVRRAEMLPWAYFQLASIAQKLKDDDLLRWAVDRVTKAERALGSRTGALEQAFSLLASPR